jgi:non-homologous end joining protein Ku
MKLIEAKAKGEEIELPEREEVEETDDLMAALEASLGGDKGIRDKGSKSNSRKKAKA